MPIIKPRGLLGGERLGKLSDEARLYWPFLYAGSNGYGRFEVNYTKIVARCFGQFHEKPGKDLIRRVLHEYREQHLAFFYEANGTMWAAWDSAAKQDYYSQDDMRSPAPPEPAFSEWKAIYRRKKDATEPDDLQDEFRQETQNSVGMGTVSGGYQAENNEIKERPPLISRSTSVSNTSVSNTSVLTKHQTSELENAESNTNVLEFRKPAQAETRAVAQGALAANGPPFYPKSLDEMNAARQISAECLEQFWTPYCAATGKEVTDDDHLDTVEAWKDLTIGERRKAVAYIETYVRKSGQPHGSPYYKLPQNYLRRKPWTAVSYAPRLPPVRGKTGDELE